MNATDGLSWDEFVAAIAAIASVSAGRITHATRIDPDLGLDSLALTELVVLLIVDFGMDHLGAELEHRDWSQVTVGDLYAECRSGLRAGSQ
jgi:acyl carrier protein